MATNPQRTRIWDTQNKEMVYDGWICRGMSGGSAWYVSDGKEVGRSNVLDDASGILMFGTGIKDDKKKEIFSGDIILVNIEIPDTNTYKKYVLVVGDMFNGSFVFEDTRDKEDFFNETQYMYICELNLVDTTEVAIIGNIHENPDLFKEDD